MTNIGRMVKLLHSTNVIQCYPPFLKLMIAYLIERQTDLTGYILGFEELPPMFQAKVPESVGPLPANRHRTGSTFAQVHLW